VHNHRTTGVDAITIPDNRHLVRRRGHQTSHVNRRGFKWTAGDSTVEKWTTVVSRRQHRNKRHLGDRRQDSRPMMRRLLRELLVLALVRQLLNKIRISIQFISVCLVTAIFVAIHIHEAVNFVRPPIFNVSIVQKWAIWPKCVVVAQQRQVILRMVNTRDSHPDALRVRVRLAQFIQMKIF
jgi:hypothetical protein